MKNFAKFLELPLVAVKPRGWLRQYLLNMRNGLTGHVEHAGKPFNTDGWQVLGKYGVACDEWGPYEQTGYWTDGAIRCGHLLRDPFLIAKARRPIERVLAEAGRDGYLGPKCIRESLPNHRWPHVVFFRAMMAHYLATGDERIPRALRRHYLAGHATHSLARDVCNVEIMLWTCAQTGDKALVRLAVQAFDGYNRWLDKLTRTSKEPALVGQPDTTLRTLLSGRRPVEHGVTFCEIGKLGAILYSHTGNRRFLQASVNGFKKVDRYSMLVDGVPSSIEHLSGKGPLENHETCVIADYTWSMGYLLMATGLAGYADKIERACFNAAPGAVTADFKALQYFSGPNQVIADRFSNHQYLARGLPYNRFGPNPGTECCAGDVHRIMPNYAARMWLSDGGGGLAAAMYGPSEITAKVGPGAAPVTIVEETDYPFGETITFKVRAKAPVRFDLHLRIPGWCRGAKVLVNGRETGLPAKAGTFVTLRRTFAGGDRVTLELPMAVRVVQQEGGVAVQRGPLVYALQIKEDWRVDPRKDGRSTKEFPAYNLYAAGQWNYALAVEGQEASEAIRVVRRRPPDRNPWTQQGAPVVLSAPARQVAGWVLQEHDSVTGMLWSNTGGVGGIEVTHKGRFRFTPPVPAPKDLAGRLSKKLHRVTLIPYGCAKLRITVFPSCR